MEGENRRKGCKKEKQEGAKDGRSGKGRREEGSTGRGPHCTVDCSVLPHSYAAKPCTAGGVELHCLSQEGNDRDTRRRRAALVGGHDDEEHVVATAFDAAELFGSRFAPLAAGQFPKG
jgi:hypothetical protein